MRINLNRNFFNRLPKKAISFVLLSSMFFSLPGLAEAVDKPATLSEKDTKKLEQFIDKKEFTYQLDFDVDYVYEQIQDIEQVDNYKRSILVNGNLDLNTLIAFVKENNAKFIFEDLEQDYYIEYNEEELEEICQIVIEEINKIIADIPNFDKKSLAALLADLKIFRINPESSQYDPENNAVASFSDDGCLALDESVFEVRRKRLSETYEQYKRRIIAHEIMHALQASSPEFREANEGKDISVSILNPSQGDVYAINWCFLIEGAAVTLIDKENRVGKYPDERGYNDLLNYTALLKDGFVPYNLELITVEKNINLLFDLFDAKSEQEQKDIINLMNAIDLNLYPDAFKPVIFSLYEKENNEPIDDEYLYYEIVYSSKITAFKLLTKQFYKNLINTVSKQPLPLKDIFYLVRQFEVMIASHIDIGGYDDLNQEFFTYYLAIQNEYFQSLNISYDDYLAYKKIGTDGNLNCDLSWLGCDKQTYVFREINYNHPDDNTYFSEYYGNNELGKAK